jgi:hypothetical protein
MINIEINKKGKKNSNHRQLKNDDFKNNIFSLLSPLTRVQGEKS